MRAIKACSGHCELRSRSLCLVRRLHSYYGLVRLPTPCGGREVTRVPTATNRVTSRDNDCTAVLRSQAVSLSVQVDEPT